MLKCILMSHESKQIYNVKMIIRGVGWCLDSSKLLDSATFNGNCEIKLKVTYFLCLETANH